MDLDPDPKKVACESKISDPTRIRIQQFEKKTRIRIRPFNKSDFPTGYKTQFFFLCR